MLPRIPTDMIMQSMIDFAPEAVLCVAVVLLLVARLFARFHVGSLALLFTLFALVLAALQWLTLPDMGGVPQAFGFAADGGAVKYLSSLGIRPPRGDASTYGYDPMFGGLLVFDALTVYLRVFLLSFTALVIWLSLLTRIPDKEDSADFYVLLLGSTLGMMLMASSTHLLMVFLAVEMASLPSYALAGFLKGRRESSEAALKYVVYGGGAAGVMLYGISLLAGKFGTGYLPDVAAGVVTSFRSGGGLDPVLLMGLLFLLIGLAFKLSAVPFHFWCPDVFEGASAEVAGFLSVASKGAALALLARLVMMFGGLDPMVGLSPEVKDWPFASLAGYLIPILAFTGAVTATFGNLAAYTQTNLKRLLAYSTIAHAGYMIMSLTVLTRSGVAAMLFYLVAYLFMNLGAFAVVAFLRNQTRSEDLNDFRGLIRRSPVMVCCLGVFLLSLLGLPPLVGFAAKFQIFSVLWTEGERYYRAGQPGLGATLWGLLAVAGLNTVLSAFFYLKVLKVMVLERQLADVEGSDVPKLPNTGGSVAFVGLMAAATLLLGVFWVQDAWSQIGVERFRTSLGVDPEAKRPAGDAPGGGGPKGGGPKGGGPKGGGPKGGGPKGKGKEKA